SKAEPATTGAGRDGGGGNSSGPWICVTDPASADWGVGGSMRVSVPRSGAARYLIHGRRRRLMANSPPAAAPQAAKTNTGSGTGVEIVRTTEPLCDGVEGSAGMDVID